MIIDMHAHIVPENFPSGAGRASANKWPSMDHFEPGRAKVMIDGENFRTVTSGNWDNDQRLKDMESHGVIAEAISPMPELLSYWFTPQDGLDFSRHVNEYIAMMCQKSPGHFFGLGMVPLQDPDLASKELASMKSAGLLGVELGSNVLGKYLGDQSFLGFFQEAERLGMAVFVHSLHPTMMKDFPTPALSNPVGFPTETCLTIASFMASGTAEKVPNLRIAWSHGGGTFPFLLGRYQNQWSGTWNEDPPSGDRGAEARQRQPHGPAEIARRFYWDTLLFDRRAIRFLIDMMGVSQVLVGTDYPYQPPERPADKTLKSLGLSQQDHDDITWHNCFRYLGVEAPKL
jgi:aminocarboxymuconate-semialdehyde decarboxylase